MVLHVCLTCAANYEAPGDQPPAECRVCTDERQYVGPAGQQWATREDLLAQGYRNRLQAVEGEPGVYSITVEPKLGIGQQARVGWASRWRVPPRCCVARASPFCVLAWPSVPAASRNCLPACPHPASRCTVQPTLPAADALLAPASRPLHSPPCHPPTAGLPDPNTTRQCAVGLPGPPSSRYCCRSGAPGRHPGLCSALHGLTSANAVLRAQCWGMGCAVAAVGGASIVSLCETLSYRAQFLPDWS